VGIPVKPKKESWSIREGNMLGSEIPRGKASMPGRE